MITAPVNKIIPFSSVDGPGNRTAVFFQGCNWDCCYCHNPETRNMCTGCMACVQVCPVGALQNENGKVHFFPERCVGCDTCIKTCRFGSSPRICNLTPEETFEQIKKQIPLSAASLFLEASAVYIVSLSNHYLSFAKKLV